MTETLKRWSKKDNPIISSFPNLKQASNEPLVSSWVYSILGVNTIGRDHMKKDGTNGKGVGFDIANGCSTTRSILHGYFNPLVFWY